MSYENHAAIALGGRHPMENVLRRACGRAGAGLLALLFGAPVWAQQNRPMLPATEVVHMGPAELYPAVWLHEAGTDSNVYTTIEDPKSDVTYTVTPRLIVVLPIGGGQFTGSGEGDIVYYQRYADQRSLDTFLDGRYDVMDARVRPFAAVGFGTHRRRSREIDARIRQAYTSVLAGANVQVTGVTSVTGWVERTGASWDEAETYRGVFLAQQLNHSSTTVAGGARFDVTPVTSLVAAAEFQRDRFELAPERDADSIRIGPRVEFSGGALIAGDAQVAYRRFAPLAADLAAYSGLTASARLALSVLDLTRVRFDAGRDVEQSYDALQPYYLEQGAAVEVIQRIVGPLEGIAILERWNARYQRRAGGSFDGRTERTTTVGGGVGARLGRRTRLSLTIDRTRRTSSEPGLRDYSRRRVFAGLEYGVF
jgi:hypothetical protein